LLEFFIRSSFFGVEEMTAEKAIRYSRDATELKEWFD
jgi:hypothetical protein